MKFNENKVIVKISLDKAMQVQQNLKIFCIVYLEGMSSMNVDN